MVVGKIKKTQLPAVTASMFSVALEHGVSVRMRKGFRRRNPNARSRVREFFLDSARHRRDMHYIAAEAWIFDEVVNDPRLNRRILHSIHSRA
jgi:hypothetical protein